MSRSRSAPSAFQSVSSNPFAFSDFGARAQACWRAQSAAADHVQRYADEWCERRREAAAAAADCCARVLGNGGDLSAAPEAWTVWMTGSVERLRQDLQAQAALATRLAGVTGDALSAGRGAPAAEPAEADEPVRLRA